MAGVGAWLAPHFSVFIRNGTNGRNASVVAKAIGVAVEMWCAAHLLPKSSTFDINVGLSEVAAAILAHEWSRKMQHFLRADRYRIIREYEELAVVMEISANRASVQEHPGFFRFMDRLVTIRNMRPQQPLALCVNYINDKDSADTSD